MFTRRDTLQIGTLSAIGLSLSQWFQLRALGSTKATAKSCILIWLDGGPSHLETFDLKPEAPAEVRGPFRAISTNVPGISICEHMPLTAKVSNHLAILRSVTSPLGEHGLAHHYLLTGYKPTPVLEYPSLGAVVSRMNDRPGILPSYIAVPELRSGGSGYLGSRFEPFSTGGDFSKAESRVRDLDPYPSVTDLRLARRHEFLQMIDQQQRDVDANSRAIEPAMEQAFRLLTSPAAKSAFDLQQESPELRERYGMRMLGQSCLLARRLVERGVPFVSIANTGWDTHDNLVVQLRDGFAGAKVGVGLLPTLDHALSALIGDLSERGLLDETLVVVMGEFGRTPKLNTRGGRDHWPGVFSVVMAGGGVGGGQVIGASDSSGERPVDQPITPADIAYSIYASLGIDPRVALQTPDGRPVAINRDGEPIANLFNL